ncbi:hypothetical protein Pla52n_29900 [Stieleria varia]|uniref:PepSY-associated TM helix n=2 Tax=Stieleria varia TaxID=2528005 RepID=A0A5C6AY38_9BACT|nr:hypothetical protein Pla52n_29900 [Stieleria varia]
MMVARRVHLYAGLFLLPWVFLYGITGAMFNHQGLFPEGQTISIPQAVVAGSAMSDFPSPDVLAQQVADAIERTGENVSVTIHDKSEAKFTNNIMFEVTAMGQRHVLHVSPHNHESYLVQFPEPTSKPTNLVADLKRVRLAEDPQDIAFRAAIHMLQETGIESDDMLKPHGWTKLNFLASVNGKPARVTYVLKDGHVDVTSYNGSTGMSRRGFFMRLHTSHGQSPSWTARLVWSLFVDTMAFAMVAWGLTGLLMWWQIKRVRVIGGFVIAASLLVACVMYIAMQHFYATNML